MNRFNHFVLLPPRSNIDSWLPLQGHPALQRSQGLSCPLDKLCCGQPISRFLASLSVLTTASASLKMPTASSINWVHPRKWPKWWSQSIYSFLEHPASSFLLALIASRFLFLFHSWNSVCIKMDWQWDLHELSVPLLRSCSPASTKVSRFGFPGVQHWGLGLVSNHLSLSGFLTMWEQTWATREESESLIFLIFNWLMIGLQYWLNFCHISTWITMGVTYVPSLCNLPPTSRHSYPSRLLQSPSLSSLNCIANSHWLSVYIC